MSNLASNVKRLRQDRGWSQAQLIEKCGVTSVKLIETGGIQSPRYPQLEALAKAFGVSVADLYAEPSSANDVPHAEVRTPGRPRRVGRPDRRQRSVR